MKKEILEVLNDLSSEFAPIKSQGEKYIDYNPRIDEEKTIGILHRPWIAPMNWGIILYKGCNQGWLPKFVEMTDKQIPEFYEGFLKSINGCFIYDISLIFLSCIT